MFDHKTLDGRDGQPPSGGSDEPVFPAIAAFELREQENFAANDRAHEARSALPQDQRKRMDELDRLKGAVQIFWDRLDEADQTRFDAIQDLDEEAAALADIKYQALEVVLRTAPTTLAGALRLLDGWLAGEYDEIRANACAFLRTLDPAAR